MPAVEADVGAVVDGAVAGPVGTLDGDPELTVTGHIFVREKVSWFEIADDLPQHPGWPPGVAFTHEAR